MKRCCLYRVIHSVTGKDYIGISVDPKQRWRQHCHKAKRGSDTYFHNALRKYGKEAFTWNVLAWCSSPENACILEKLALAMGMGTYNLTMGGEGLFCPSAETRLKMSQARKCRPPYKLTEEHKQNIGKAGVGRKTGPRSADFCERMAALKQGKPLTEDHKRKISEGLRQHYGRV